MNFSVEPVRRDANNSFSLDSSSHEGITVGQATFPALTCTNAPDQRHPQRFRYFTYFTNQRHVVAVDGSEPFYLQANEIVLLSTSKPWTLHFSKPYNITTLAIDEDLVGDFLPDHERLTAKRLSFPCNLNKALTSLVQSAHSIAKAGYFDQGARILAQSFFSTLSLTQLGRDKAQVHAESRLSLEVRRLQIKSHIDQHYAWPDLSVSSIASRLHVSPRYIQKAFAGDSLAPAEYLRQRRLEAAAALLSDACWAGHSVTDVAFACGFNSSSYFSTQFRRAYGESPDAYRKRLQERHAIGPA